MTTSTESDAALLSGDRLYMLMKHAVNAPHFNRNAYCCETHGDIYRDWLLLCGIGMAKAGPKINDGRDQYFYATHEGIVFMRMLCEGGAR